jgi:hypothetical protein
MHVDTTTSETESLSLVDGISNAARNALRDSEFNAMDAASVNSGAAISTGASREFAM